MPSRGDVPNPGIIPRSPSLQADSLPAEPQGKSKNTRVGKLSLLQGVFPIQESNWGLLHCRQILYQLRYQVLYYCNLKAKITAANAITSWQIDGDKVEPVADFFFPLVSKITVDSDRSHKIKRHLHFERKDMTNLDSVSKKQRHHFANKVHPPGV